MDDIYKNNRFKEKIRITPEDNQWIMQHCKQYGYKSAAGFLEEIIKQYKSLNKQDNA